LRRAFDVWEDEVSIEQMECRIHYDAVDLSRLSFGSNLANLSDLGGVRTTVIVYHS
jgi:hypothetical protein